ncbi:hypothetical protein G9A89_008390 [Geosiphon pyriformis]|nr:hypothetical protein G9A89_008390 [Geosiphon pyriformis]
MSQMAIKAKNSKKQQQAVTTAMVTPNLFVVSDEIFLAKQSINPDDLKDWADQMEMESTVSSPVSGAADGSAWENVNVFGATFKIKMALLGSLFQLLPGYIGLKSVLQDAESLSGATKVAISNEVFLTTLKIVLSSGVDSLFSLSLSVALHDVSLSTSSNDIKTALGIFGVVTSVKLKPAGLWQYAVVNFKDIFSAAVALFHWSVLVKKDSVRIFSIANQKEVISSRNTFKAKLVNLPFGCTVFEISNLVSQKTPECCCCYRCQDLNHLAVDCKMLPSLPPKLPSNSSGGPKNFKPSFVGSKSYAKTAVFVVPPGAAAANMDLDLSGSLKSATPMLPTVPSVFNTAVESRLASLESYLSELFVLIKSLVESVGALVALITKLLSTLSAIDVLVKKCVNELVKQNKDLAAVASVTQKKMTCFEKICEQVCLENGSDVDDMIDNVDDDNDEDKDFSVYNNIFNIMMHLWEDQSFRIKSSLDQTAKWMSGMVKNSHEFVSIMDKMYELDMFDTLGSKGSTSV